MWSTRRGFILTAALASLAPGAAALARSLRSSAATAAPALRPAPLDSSARRCARCGATDHGILGPGCPADTEGAAARQVAARRLAARDAGARS
jgi:hypothetical protein